MASDWLDIPTTDGSFKGYMALPPSGRGSAVILLQEIFGINGYMRKMAELFASEGYVAVVPDLFWRMEPGVSLEYSERDRAVYFMRNFDESKGMEDVAATIEAVGAHSATSGGLALVGYCLGGRLAVLGSVALKVDGAVAYYGTGMADIIGGTAASSTPIMLHFGEMDTHSPPNVIEVVKNTVAGREDRQVYVYPGAEHGFNSAARAAFNHNASLLAHDRTMQFLRRYVSARPT